MGFWVQYHNLDLNDGLPYDGQHGYEGKLCINTSVEGVAKGDTVFLIVGHQD